VKTILCTCFLVLGLGVLAGEPDSTTPTEKQELIYIRRGTKAPVGRTFSYYEDLSLEEQKIVVVFEAPKEDPLPLKFIILDGQKVAVVKRGQEPKFITYVYEGPWLIGDGDLGNCKTSYG
jgi:hypothetical protein